MKFGIKQTMVVAAALVSLFVLIAPAAAQPGRRGGPPAEMNLRMLERAADRLGLDEATLDRIKLRVYEAEKVGIDLKAKFELAKLELRRALDADTADKAAVMGRIEEVGRLETELRKHQVGLMMDVHAMLTPEQRTKLKQMTRRARGERGKRRGKRGKKGADESDGAHTP